MLNEICQLIEIARNIQILDIWSNPVYSDETGSVARETRLRVQVGNLPCKYFVRGLEFMCVQTFPWSEMLHIVSHSSYSPRMLPDLIFYNICHFYLIIPLLSFLTCSLSCEMIKVWLLFWWIVNYREKKLFSRISTLFSRVVSVVVAKKEFRARNSSHWERCNWSL